MAFNRAMLRDRNWWFGLIGFGLQVVGWFFLPDRTAGLVLVFVGLGLFFLWIKAAHENSELRTKKYELFPQDRQPRTL